MPVHDWTRVAAGIFHAIQVDWIPEIQKVLNGGLLPPGYYALPEQHAGDSIADVLTLHTSARLQSRCRCLPPQAAPFWPRRRPRCDANKRSNRTCALSAQPGHSPRQRPSPDRPAGDCLSGEQGSRQTIEDFADKAVSMLRSGVHLLVVDLFPSGPYDPQGMHGAIQQRLNEFEQPYDLPADEPLTLASYAAGPRVDAYLEHVAVCAYCRRCRCFCGPIVT